MKRELQRGAAAARVLLAVLLGTAGQARAANLMFVSWGNVNGNVAPGRRWATTPPMAASTIRSS